MTSQLTTESALNDSIYRLPENVSPFTYNMHLKFGNFAARDLSFTGQVTILLDIKEDDVDEIVLHCHETVEISDLKLYYSDGATKGYLYLEKDFNAEREILIISPEKKLAKGSIARLEIQYSGQISSETPLGIYRGSYWENSNQQRLSAYHRIPLSQQYKQNNIFFMTHSYFIATHMKPGHFRRICPSFDEPSFKAFFSNSLEFPRGYHAISNMPNMPDSSESADDECEKLKFHIRVSKNESIINLCQQHQNSDHF